MRAQATDLQRGDTPVLLHAEVKRTGQRQLYSKFVETREFAVSGVIAQVEFSDSSGSLDLSAVQVDRKSTYTAEDTSFIGFEGEVRFAHNRAVDPLVSFPSMICLVRSVG